MFEPLFTAQGKYFTEHPKVYFEVSADAKGRWQINVTWDIFRENYISYHHSSFDGTNVYSTTHSTKIWQNGRSKNVPNLFTGAAHPAQIKRGPLPFYPGGIGLWSLFFSGKYIAKNPDFKIPNMFRDHQKDPRAWAYDFEYEWHENAKSPLLKSGKFRLNPDLLYDDLIHYPEVSEPSEVMLQHIIYDIGWHRKFAKHAQKENPELLMLSSFQVEEIVSGANFSFPKKVTWERYNINPTNVAMRYLSLKGVLEITNYIIHPRGKRVPLLPKLTGTNVGFQDFRFQFRDDRKYFNQRWYELSDGIWPVSTNDSRIAKSSKMIFEPRTRLGKRNFMYFLNVTLAIILFSLPAIFWFQKQRSKR